MTQALDPVALMTQPPLPAREFLRFRELILALAGIHFREEKLPLLAAKLGRRVRALGLASFTQYYEVVERDEEERQRMLEAVCTGETRFFREPHHFELISQVLIPRWKRAVERGQRPRKVRAWSAGCSTGEEPHSIAMALLAGLGEGFEIEVLATDLSRQALEAARAGLWNVERVNDVPLAMRRYLLKGVGRQTGRMKATPQLQGCLRFRPLNLHQPSYPVEPGLDLIFCRNVLIYFGAEAKAAVLRRLAAMLAPDGHLFLGHAESITGQVQGLKTVHPTVYARERREPS